MNNIDAGSGLNCFGVSPVAQSQTLPQAAPHDNLLASYRRLTAKRFLMLLVLALAVVVAFVIDVASGSSNLPLITVITGLFAPDSLNLADATIIWQLRLPHALMAVLVGGALSLAGAEMQTLLNNPLASPFTLGVSSAASFGAALAIVLGIGLPFLSADWAVPINAFICAFGSILLLLFMSRMRRSGVQTVVLLGIALVFAFNALVAFIQFLSSQVALQQFVFWSMGSLSRSGWREVTVMALMLVVLVPLSLRSARSFTALRLGEDRARSFGINVERLRFVSLLRVSILAATSVAFVGTIGFIGLVGPHIARLMLGEDHRFLLPASILTGALVMSLASVASKLLVPGTLIPIGIVTAMIGVPVFLLLIFRKSEQA